MDPDEVVGAKFRMYRVGSGYVRTDWLDDAELTAEDAREVLESFASFTTDGPTPLLVDGRTAHSATREARQLLARTDLTSRAAMLVDSPLSRTLANFFLGVSGRSVPARIFTDLDDAQRWLLDDR